MQTFDVRNMFQGSFATKRTSTKYIVVHHAAALYRQRTGIEDVRTVADYHTKTKGWPGIGYHVCLAELVNGGEVARYVVSNPDLERAHTWGRNHEAVSVSCLTNFTGIPEAKWLDALVQAIIDLRQLYPQAQVVGHTDVAKPGYTTSCPGPLWRAWKPTLLARVDWAKRVAQEPAQGASGTLTPILGPNTCTIAQLVRYLLAGKTIHYASADITNVIVPAYAQWCSRMGVDLCVAGAQLCEESDRLRSFWCARPRRNPAGLGVNGDTHEGQKPGDNWAYNPARHLWEAGLSFESWAKHSIPMHVTRLAGYAASDSALTPDQRAVVEAHNARRPIPLALRGSARTIRELSSVNNPTGSGWATNPNYPQNLVRHMTAIRSS